MPTLPPSNLSALEQLRRAFDQGQTLPALPEAESAGTETALAYEILAYDAWSRGVPGWAFICFEAAADLAERDAQKESAAEARRRGQRVLDHRFPPYDSDADALADVRAWAQARLLEVFPPRAEEEVRSAPLTVALKHRWMFRLVQSHRSDRRLRFEELAVRFQLSSSERVWLRTLLAIYGDKSFEAVFHELGWITAGVIADLLTDTEGRAHDGLAAIDGRNTLIRQRLIHLRGVGGLRNRGIDIEESVAAFVTGRTFWPPDLAGRCLLEDPAERSGWPWQRASLRRLDRSLSPTSSGRRRVALTADAEASVRETLATWSGISRRPLLIVRDLTLTPPSTLQDIDREARLRDGVIVVERGAVAYAARIAATIEAPVVFDVAPGVLARLRREIPSLLVIRCGKPAAADQGWMWNNLLADEGLPEFAPQEITAALGPYGLDAAAARGRLRTAIAERHIEERNSPLTIEDLRRSITGETLTE